MSRSIVLSVVLLAEWILAGCSSGAPGKASPCASTRQIVCGSGAAATCANLGSDNLNCGACGVSCPSGKTCQGGSCGCLAGLTDCDGSCADFLTNSAHCGTCANPCAAGNVCSNGSCALSCDRLLSTCTPPSGAAYCANESTDPSNCGVCGKSCPAGEGCSAGACACPSNQTYCSTASGGTGCFNLLSEGVNCGACGKACAAGLTCQSGTCGCGASLTVCGGSCTDLSSDNSHCGSCGTICQAGTACSSGTCALSPVQVVANRDSAVFKVPEIAGAQDYRVFALGPGVTVVANPDGTETVNGATIFCAGREQHAAPVSEKPNRVMLKIEALDIRAKTTFAVEALDRECPFAGVVGAAARDFPLEPDVFAYSGSSFPMRTEDQVRSQYGSLIINGQGSQALLGYPAPANPPKVLARASVDVTPLGTANAPMPFFDDFSDSTDQFQFVGLYSERVAPGAGLHLANSKWNLFVIDPDSGWYDSQAHKYYGVNIHHGQLTSHATQQEAFGQNIFSPKQPVSVSDTKYLHVTFESSVNATDRRYWWFSLCGPSQAGATYDASGYLKARVQLTPFFYQTDGLSPYIEGWNCLQMFPFEGSYSPIGPTNTRAEASLRLILNKSHEGVLNNRDNVRNVGPKQWDPNDTSPACQTCGWYNSLDASKNLTGPLFDDLMYLAPRIKFDIYIRRDRVVLYANGAQKICNDFPTAKLTMAEGAIALGNVLYHSSAEHLEFTRADWVRDAQRAFLTILPWVAQHNFDNIGYEENLGSLPTGFDPATCWVSPQTW